VNDEVGFVSVRVRRSWISVATCSAKAGYFRDLYDEVFFVSRRVRRGRISVGTCTTKFSY